MFDEKRAVDEKKDRMISRADVMLAVIVCGVALGLFAAHRIGAKEGGMLVITWEGAEVERLPLTEGLKDRAEAAFGADGTRYCQMLYTEGGIFLRWYEEGETPPQIPEGTSYNVLRLSGTEVSMEAADCRDQICVHHIPIKGNGESIICLPHKLALEIRGGSEEEAPDGMVK